MWILVKMFRTIAFFVMCCQCCVLAQDASSLLTGLLSTFATSSRNPGCPGECRHALSALFCSNVLEDADCGDSQLRCCTNPPATPPPPPRLQRPMSTSPPKNGSNVLDGRRPMTPGEHTFSRPPMLTQSNPISVVTNLTVRPTQAKPPRSKPVSRLYPKRRSTTTMPMAVKNRTVTSAALPLPTAAAITAEAIIPETSSNNNNNNNNNKNSNSNVHDRTSNSNNNNGNVNDKNSNSNNSGNDNIRNNNSNNVNDRHSNANEHNGNSNDNVRNNVNKGNDRNSNSKKPCEGMCVSNFVASFCTRTSESSHCSPGETCCFTGDEEDVQPDPPMTNRPQLTTKPTTKQQAPTTNPPSTTLPPSTTTSTTSRPRPTRPTSVQQSVVTKVPPRQPDMEDAVAECAGTCVMGLLYMLCTDIDQTVSCDNGGKCCISKDPEETAIEEEVATTTIKPSTKKCPGICLPSLLSGVCNRPAILLPETLDCEGGSICCDNSLRETGQGPPTTTTTTTTTPSSPLLDMLSWPLKLGALGAAAGLGGQSKPGDDSSDISPLAATTSLIGPLVELFTSGGGQSSNSKDGQIFGGQGGGNNNNGGNSNGGQFFGGQGSGNNNHGGNSNGGQFFGGQGGGNNGHGGNSNGGQFNGQGGGNNHGSNSNGGQFFGSQGNGNNQGSNSNGGQFFGGQGGSQGNGQFGGQGGDHNSGHGSGQFGGQGGNQNNGQGSGQFGVQGGGQNNGQGSGQFGGQGNGQHFGGQNDGQGGGQGFRPPQSPTSSTIDRVQNDKQQRPKCPGTCIASFLKMTCFGSSQLTEAFSCPKENLMCCAPKSAVLGPPMDSATSADTWNNTYSRYPVTDTSALGFSQRPSVNKYVCGMKGAGRPETPRVVGGRDASPGEWCWQVALINSLNQYLCGGALIGRQWVLTAAHCVTNLIRSGDAIYVRVGDFDLSSKYGSPGAQTLRVSTTYIHHNHNSQTLDNNLALLKMETPADLGDAVCLVCLPARGVPVEAGRRCVVTGYGYMGESGPIPLRIREAMLPIVSEQECVRKINAVTEKIFILPASSFCAGGEEGHDACQGDGGGPLSCEVDGYYELTGIVSWGFGCGRADVPGIYVKVSSFIGWINQIISVNSV